MLWVLDKKVFRHVAETRRGLLEIPVRVSFEYAVENDAFVARTMSRDILYNRPFIERHLRREAHRIDLAIIDTVDQALVEHLRFAGHLDAPLPLYPAPEVEAEPQPPAEAPAILLSSRGPGTQD